jgi:hypothetical protein
MRSKFSFFCFWTWDSQLEWNSFRSRLCQKTISRGALAAVFRKNRTSAFRLMRFLTEPG